MISIYSMVYNEEHIIKFFIDHYKFRFPSCEITIYDNFSTDNTKKIAVENGCNVIDYNTNNLVNDEMLRDLKNNCWKNASNNWVMVVDADELLEVSEKDLLLEDKAGSSILKFEAYNMINMEDNYNINQITHGMRSSNYDKSFIFNKSKIKEINYVHGAHRADPIGLIKYSNNVFKCYHFNTINPELTFKRHYVTKDRISDINKKHGWGVQYFNERPLEQIIQEFKNARAQAIKVRGL